MALGSRVLHRRAGVPATSRTPRAAGSVRRAEGAHPARFVAEGIRAFQPPEALQRVVGIVARESEARLDWTTLIICVETRKSTDTYETESLTDSIVEYADVVVAVVGADVVAE